MWEVGFNAFTLVFAFVFEMLEEAMHISSSQEALSISLRKGKVTSRLQNEIGLKVRRSTFAQSSDQILSNDQEISQPTDAFG